MHLLQSFLLTPKFEFQCLSPCFQIGKLFNFHTPSVASLPYLKTSARTSTMLYVYLYKWCTVCTYCARRVEQLFMIGTVLFRMNTAAIYTPLAHPHPTPLFRVMNHTPVTADIAFPALVFEESMKCQIIEF